MIQTKNGARFTYGYENGILYITDLDAGGRSVTNDVETILTMIHHLEVEDLSRRKIIYRDSEGWWDGIKAENSGDMIRPRYRATIYAVRGRNLREAIGKVSLTPITE